MEPFMEITKASVAIAKKFLDAGSQRPAAMTEMQEFWKSLSDDEKLQFTREAVTLMPELTPAA